MTDNFYLNSSLPSGGAVPNNKPFSKDLRSRLGVFAISDGFGLAGESTDAAHKVLSLIKKYHEKMGTVTVEALGTVVEAYAEEANAFMRSLGDGIGASIAMLVINHGVATAINAGSARVYSYKYGRLNRLSVDDTEAQHLLNIGAIRREEAMDHPSRRTLTSAIGLLRSAGGQRLHMSSPTPVENGDLFLLCSNGLTDYLSDDRISYILSLHMSNERLAQRLVSEAIARGADDNVSVLIVRNGKNAKPSRVPKGLAKGVVLVVLLAVLAAFLLARPWKRNNTPSQPVETASPTPTAASILNQGTQADDFELR
ncbi:MAG: serine/threonine-protein phosphatase [Ruminococcaceae bacterium]|nr:serine/threonine-protein phosphatase [Oscillospiraceae bacterium]